MKKKLADYIFLYLGCPILSDRYGMARNAGLWFTSENLDNGKIKDDGLLLVQDHRKKGDRQIVTDVSECRLVLTSIDNVSPEEWQKMAKELNAFCLKDGEILRKAVLDIRRPATYDWQQCINAGNVLRKHGVDCDELIQSGLAIESKSLHSIKKRYPDS